MKATTSFLLCDSTLSSAINLYFLSNSLSPKRKIILKEKNIEQISEISIIISLICQKLGSIGPVQQKIKLPPLGAGLKIYRYIY